MKNKPAQKGFATVLIIGIVLLAMVLLVGTILFLRSKKLVQKSSEQQTPASAVPHGAFPISLLKPEIPADTPSFVAGQDTFVQPDFFDPKVSKYYKVDAGGSPRYLYRLDDSKDGVLMKIDGWSNEGEDKVLLNQPYAITSYKFGVASSFDSVLDLRKNDQRVTLYTKVNTWGVSQDKKYLYLSNSVKNQQGQVERLRRIIEIETGKSVRLPNMECVGGSALWSGDKLLSYSDKNEWESHQEFGSQTKPYLTKVCIWSNQGQLEHMLSGDFYWGAASASFLAGQIGLLPTNSAVFYLYGVSNPPGDNNICEFYLQNLEKPNERKAAKVNFGSDEFSCDQVDLDLSNFQFSSTTMRYRSTASHYDENSGSFKRDLGEWKEVTLIK